MLIPLLYLLVALYLLLMTIGVLHRPFFRKISHYNRPTLRFAIFLLAMGLLLMGGYQGCLYYTGYIQQLGDK